MAPPEPPADGTDGPTAVAGDTEVPEYFTGGALRDEDNLGGKRVKYMVADVPVYVVAERVQYYDKDGKLITETARLHPPGRARGVRLAGHVLASVVHERPQGRRHP